MNAIRTESRQAYVLSLLITSRDEHFNFPFRYVVALCDSWICSVVKLADGCRRQKALLFRGTTFSVWGIVLQKMADRYFEEIVWMNSEWCNINFCLVVSRHKQAEVLG